MVDQLTRDLLAFNVGLFAFLFVYASLSL